MSFPRYPAYKKTDHSWLGEIPSTWSTQKFRHLFNESSEKIEKKVFGDMLSVSGYRGIELKEYDDENRRRRDEELVGYRIVRRGQLVVNTMWLNYAGLGFSELDGHVSPAYRAYWTRTDENERYLHYLLRSEHYVKGYTRLLTGVRPNSLQMSRDNMMSFPVILPPKEEQLAIATFLDRETTKIDDLIAEQRRLIELLQEKRQAVISHAVTKGLNPNAPMKDSGVEWLGEVPEHWSVSAVGHRYEVRLGKMLDEKRVKGEHLGPYLRNADVQWESINVDELPEMDFEPSEYDRYSLREGDLLVCEGGEIGRSAIWQSQLAFCFYQKAIHRLRPYNQSSDNSHFQLYVMRMACSLGVFEASSGKATINHLPAESFRRYRFAYPPFDEQIAIAKNLFQVCARMNELETEAQSLVSALQERRSALISAAVTGQIDVRGLVSEASAA